MRTVLEALLATENPPMNYALTEANVTAVAACYDWQSRWEESGWSPGTTEYVTLADMIVAEPGSFLADISRYYGDDQYLHFDPREEGGENLYDDSMDGDAESALASAGWGTDEDYGGYGGGEDEF